MTKFTTNLQQAYDSIWVEEWTAHTIEANNRRDALLKRMEDIPEYQFQAKVRAVTLEHPDWHREERTATTEFWNYYVDYSNDNEDYSILKMFSSLNELKDWLREEQ